LVLSRLRRGREFAGKTPIPVVKQLGEPIVYV